MPYTDVSIVYPQYSFCPGKGTNAVDAFSGMFQPDEVIVVSSELIAKYTTAEQWYDHIDSLNPSKNTLNSGTFEFNAAYGPCFKVTAGNSQSFMDSKQEFMNYSSLVFDLPRIPKEFNMTLQIPSQPYTTGGSWVALLLTQDDTGYVITRILSEYATTSKIFTVVTDIGTAFPTKDFKSTNVSAITTPFNISHTDFASQFPEEVRSVPCKLCFVMDKSYTWSTVGTKNFLTVYISKLSFKY